MSLQPLLRCVKGALAKGLSTLNLLTGANNAEEGIAPLTVICVPHWCLPCKRCLLQRTYRGELMSILCSMTCVPHTSVDSAPYQPSVGHEGP